MVISLSGSNWQFRAVGEDTWRPAVVPGCVHQDLLRAGAIPDPFFATNELDVQWIEERDWEYRTTFPDAPGMTTLALDGLDTVATVILNGEVLGTTDNMFVAHRFAVSLRPENELVIRFASAMHYVRTHRTDLEQGELNDPLGLAPAIRKEQCQFGWDWGPRLVTAGIWKDLRLEAASPPEVRIRQVHEGGAVTLVIDTDAPCRGTVSLRGEVVAPIEDSRAVIAAPELWWPNGHGAQPLYDLTIEIGDATLQRRVGLRTIALDRHADDAGETFQFVINGRAVFAKGANWIPAHAFVADLPRTAYQPLLEDAALANMNMIRVWGGGIYESEHFYDLCDELGLLVWQDFMFACALYPADEAFLASVRVEAEQAVKRLRHRACLALWCGNNEVVQLNVDRLKKPHRREEYAAVFERLLPEVVAEHDGVTAYWPSSQHRPDWDHDRPAGERHGDTHYWDVWHARQPVKSYEKWRFRFVSEFGMQSYSSPETNATFCPPDDTNVFGAAMENHQKNRGGNQVILDYVSRRYRLPRSQDDLIWLSQLNQAYCMQVGVEHYRRLMPHCMGALYWQLNDCWPVASWSSIEFGGRWRALHHVARRFFAPAIASVHVPGDETAGVGNYRQSTIREAHLYTVYDGPGTRRGRLSWTLFTDAGPLESGALDVELAGSRRQLTLGLEPFFAKHGRDRVLLRVALDVDGARVSEDTTFFAPPRFVALPRGEVTAAIDVAEREARLTFTASTFLHRFAFELAGLRHRASDNWFELYPGEPKTVSIALDRSASEAELRAALSWRSLADTYA